MRLEIQGVSVARGGRALFEGLTFAAEAGAFIALRGANGAGKTSLLRAIAGYGRPRAGRIVLHGVEEPALALHFVGHANAIKGGLSAGAQVAYWAALLGGAHGGGDALARVGLAAQRALPARALSQGQARRLALARLLAAPRPLWLLDEPAAALDADGRAMLGALIEAHCAGGGLAIAAVHEPLPPTPSQTIDLDAGA